MLVTLLWVIVIPVTFNPLDKLVFPPTLNVELKTLALLTLNVDPKTAQRSDQDYVRLMKAKFGHSNLGVFAKVIKGGEIKVGDELLPI